MVSPKLTELIGQGNVVDTPGILEGFSLDLSGAPQRRPACVVRPHTAEEIQKLVRWANETGTPLIPVSSGPPHFRGDTVPETDGAVVIDLSSMDRVLRIDRRNRVAMIEPGVTFTSLIPALAGEGLRLNPPLLPRARKSVIGSMLEREPVLMPLYQWDAVDPLTCVEVVFGTGERFCTGSAAGPGTLEEQWGSGQAQVNQMGPGQTDFARVIQGAQGTIGVVTWATVRCEALPSVRKPFLIGAEAFGELTDFSYQMLWHKFGDEFLAVNRTDLTAMLAGTPGAPDNTGNSLPPWILFFSLAGFEYFPEDRIAYQEKEMTAIAGRCGLRPASELAGVTADTLAGIVSTPSAEPYWKLRPRGNCLDIFFLSTLDRAPQFIAKINDIAGESGYPAADIGMYVQPMVQGTSCHCEFTFFFDPANEAETSRIRELEAKAVTALMDAGAFFSRPYGIVADMAYRHHPDTASVLKKVRGIFDPNNIMNPGKLCF